MKQEINKQEKEGLADELARRGANKWNGLSPEIVQHCFLKAENNRSMPIKSHCKQSNENPIIQLKQ